MSSVLLLEDEPVVQELIRNALLRTGFEVHNAGNCLNHRTPAHCAIDCCPESVAPDIVVLAVIARRPCSGVEVAHKALQKWPGTKILLISTSPLNFWPAAAQDGLKTLPRHSYAFLPKPFQVQQLLQAIGGMLNTSAFRASSGR